ncbi:hypothetical protein Dda_5215 [Drechslerella dactyloides]|uniref:Uncharacterized protein n=1 Tax=Drechslerella dactyloides TaxID=74499 RepID=A0AAD6IWD2_DREDA|nr:hypothetical protein Dda_5215 [Drechslerella dactyloides]
MLGPGQYLIKSKGPTDTLLGHHMDSMDMFPVPKPVLSVPESEGPPEIWRLEPVISPDAPPGTVFRIFAQQNYTGIENGEVVIWGIPGQRPQMWTLMPQPGVEDVFSVVATDTMEAWTLDPENRESQGSPTSKISVRPWMEAIGGDRTQLFEFIRTEY